MVQSASGAARWTILPGYGPRGTYGLAGSSLGSYSPRVMKSSRGSLPDIRGPFTTALVRGVPDDRGGRALRDHSFSHRLYPRNKFESCCLSRVLVRPPRRFFWQCPSCSRRVGSLQLVRGSAQCETNCPTLLIDGFGRVPRADVG